MSDDRPVREVRQVGDATVVVLAGDVDLHGSPALDETLVTVCRRKPPRLIINLESVGYIDSSGVATLVKAFQSVNAYRGRLALAGMNDRVRSVFEITKLDQFFTICHTEKEALEA